MENNPVKLYYRECGQGTPLVLVHGFPLNHSIWNEVAEKMSESARVILPDLRGHGRSPAPEGGYSMRTLADDLRQLLDHLKIEKAILVGHSMGGYACLAFAQAYPERLAGFGLISSQAEADVPEKRQGRYHIADQVKAKGVRVIVDGMAEKLTCLPELVEPLRQLMLHVATVNGVVGALQGMAERPDATGWLSNITVPALVVAGKADAIIPLERSQTMAQFLGRGWLVEIEGAGHMPMMESPQQVIGALKELLSHVK
jgi:3-oxoadipate enol-lactonase